MRNLVLLIICLLGGSLTAQEIEDRAHFGSNDTVRVLNVLSSTDTDVFAPIALGFLAAQEDISIAYSVAGSADIPAHIANCADCYDVVISSAMDLQLKLVNDGAAQELAGIDTAPWAHWRNSLFGFTLEPATIVLNRLAFKGREVPQTRQQLIEVLRAEPEMFRGRLGTYDVRLSGLGYLFATQDARTSETYWRLMEVFGSLDAKLYCCSGAMIDDLMSGDLAVAYNVLGSYAQTRQDAAESLAIITPGDFATTMMRTALVLETAPSPDLGAEMVSYLASGTWADPTQPGVPMPSLRKDTGGTQNVVTLEPGLFIYLDALKRQSFLGEWTSALLR